MSEAKHTPLTLSGEQTMNLLRDSGQVLSTNGMASVGIDMPNHYAAILVYGETLAEAQARAKFLLRACNAHDELVAVAEAVIRANELRPRVGDVVGTHSLALARLCDAACRAQAALAKARPQQGGGV